MDNALDVPGPGTVLQFSEADVFGGNGDLRLRVASIADGKLVHRQAEWVTVEGTALNEDGSDRGYRSALVRLSALLGQSPAADGPIRPVVVADTTDSRAKRF